MTFSLLDWLYRRLGGFYPSVMLGLELMTAFLVTAGAVGLIALFYAPDAATFFLILALCEALTAIGVTANFLILRRRLRPIREWIRGDRSNRRTVKAWDIAVGMPARVVRTDLALPVLLVALPATAITVAAVSLPWLAFFPIMAGALVAVGYSGILHVFALETLLRPVILDIDRHLPQSFRPPAMRFPIRLKLMAALPLMNIITGLVVAALTSPGGGGAGLGISVLVATGVAFTISLELTVILSRSIMHPIRRLQGAMARVRQGDYEAHVPVMTSDEIGELAAGFNAMVAGLAERDQLRRAFSTYLDREVADYILEQGFRTEGTEVEASVMFCDVRDFTQFSHRAPAAETVAALNELFEAIVPVIARHGGHIDKFIGDCVMAVFGPPQGYEDHADRAVAAGLGILDCVRGGRAGRFRVGIGINSGRVIAGNIGGAGRLNFSVIGDPVNVASRVQEATGVLDVPLLITSETRRLLREPVPVEPLGPVSIRGRAEPVEVFSPSELLPGAPGEGAGREGGSAEVAG